MPQNRVTPELGGVQETMLWTLYERASEASRPGGIIRDPEGIRIYQSIDYDFPGHFGVASGLAPARATKIDIILRKWLTRHPHGSVVSLGEGLETQAYRVDNGSMTWLTVDLPDAIQFRECFIRPSPRFRHLAMSALDPGWMDHVDGRSGLFIVAQGLLMYFNADTVRQLLVVISERFSGAEMVFDLLPHNSTNQRHEATPTWTSPMMSWGLDRNEVTATLRSWLPRLKCVKSTRYRVSDRRPAIVEDILDAVLPHRQKVPSLAHLHFL
jgi:O-methyltransferase involved in polyketide biosynthesis